MREVASGWRRDDGQAAEGYRVVLRGGSAGGGGWWGTLCVCMNMCVCGGDRQESESPRCTPRSNR